MILSGRVTNYKKLLPTHATFQLTTTPTIAPPRTYLCVLTGTLIGTPVKVQIIGEMSNGIVHVKAIRSIR